MRISPHASLVYFLALTVSFFCTSCVSQPKSVHKDVAPVLAAPAEPVAVQDNESAAKNYAPGDAAYPEGYYVHTVSIPAENITIIAGWYTNARKNWLVLVQCNPDIQPNRILMGDKIKIPRSLLTRETPLPAEYVQQSQAEPQRKRKKKISPQKPATTTAKPAAEEDPLLFGPKGY